MGDKYAMLQRAQLRLEFIHANSTTHSFLFGAMAELLDNARDAGAARLDVFSVDNGKLQGGFMLCFLDDGCGMSPEDASDIIYFGTSKKRLSTMKFIGQYGNGLKSGSMRIGKDFILFTKTEETMTCVFFSQTFCEREGLSEVVVPMPSWLTRTRKPIADDPQKFSMELSIIYKYSPFKTEAELIQQFDVIYGKCGTLLVIYNLKLLLSGEPELDVKTDKEDILMAGALEDFPERWSFRAYTSVLYFDPWMRIFIQAKKVQTKHLCYCLYRPRKYLSVTSSFKGALKNEAKKAEEEVRIAELALKEAQTKVNHPGTTTLSSAKFALQKALEDVEAKHKNLGEKQRTLKRTQKLSLFFGVNIENLNRAGMFIYSNNRLIKMYEKVGPQLKLKSLLGAGVIGVVNVPLDIMEPSHNKQEFLNVQKYNHLLKVMGQYLVQYCKDTGISNRNITQFCNEFGYQNNMDIERPLVSTQYKRKQAMAIPFIIQCDLCLKWRVLPPSTNYEDKEFLDMWICANNPNLSENSCHHVEHLPFIPLGTTSTVLSSENEKEKKLRESVQRYQNKLAEQLPQLQFIPTSKISELTSVRLSSAPTEKGLTRKIKPSGGNLKHVSLSSLELSDSHRSQKRLPEEEDCDVEYVLETNIRKTSMRKSGPKNLPHETDCDVEFVSETNIRKKSTQKRMRYTAAMSETVSLAEKSKVSLEMKRKQRPDFAKKCQVLMDTETSDSDPEVILVLNGSDADVLLKQEKKEVLINKEKQELHNDIPAINGTSSLSNQQSLFSVSTGDFSPSSGHKEKVAVNDGCEAVASWETSSQSTFVKETMRKLMSNLREMLLYFFPEYQLPAELDYISVEELTANSELKQWPEQTNQKLQMCFYQIQNVYMVQYEKKLKKKVQSIIYEANRRGVLNEISLGQCEKRRKIAEGKLEKLRVQVAALLHKFQLGCPVGDPEQIDVYLEALLKEDVFLSRSTLNEVAVDKGHSSSLE
ncbi:MORC family CW-type zinc finger protein 1 [Ochotona princeps]|uniref:MORC family CW-type zinc finger protein 1 n=1 Tax=Ochotona princeps TaxID=9978 RepID=UPI002714C9FB|nr:MORC family CW-type zinc finger protein 1 [Ochotona princeps]